MSARFPSGAVAGRWSKWVVVLIWAAIAGIATPLASKLSDVTTNNAVSFLPHSAEATQAYERASAEFAGAEQLVAVVVYARDTGLTAADKAKAGADAASFAALAEGGRVSPLIESEDGQAAIVSFPVAGDEEVRDASIEKIKNQLGTGGEPGLQAALTGPAGAVDDVVDAFAGIDTTLLFVTAGVVAVLLLITYRSPVLWIIPLLTVGIASQLATAAVYLLAKYADLTVNGQSQGIMTVLVFGAGTDYALLLIARYREELRRHRDRHDAMKEALRRSSPAILASAATVTISLLCLLAAQLNSLRGLGPVGAIGVAAGLVSMITLLPALLVICGRWLFWPFVPRYAEDAAAHDVAEEHGIWGRVAGLVGRRPRMLWTLTTAALLALTIGVTNLSLGLPESEQFTKEVGSVTGGRLVEAHFPGGTSSPVQVIARASATDPVVAAVRTVPGVATVQDPVTSRDGTWVRVDAVLADPPDSEAAARAVDAIRAATHAVPGSDALVGGDTAVQLDTERAAADDNRLVIPLILIVVFLVLVILLRAVVAPLLLIASVVVSFGAALGGAALIFNALGYPKIDLTMPLLAFLFLVALGVDYTIFLMTRVREEAATLGHREGVLHALTVTGGVITSAGIVLAATFAVLTVLPLVSLMQIGIVVALGVLLDTLIVRTLIVPALSLDVGRRVWWPSALSRTPHSRTPHSPSEPS
ncbi:MMPL family transporter [Luedemannella helvata]|uniref:MMPL family transporter n=1 Tax=Luedemannella helvata TaxID=349315 RepID=A0ABP4VSJ7_9ACTN